MLRIVPDEWEGELMRRASRHVGRQQNGFTWSRDAHTFQGHQQQDSQVAVADQQG